MPAKSSEEMAERIVGCVATLPINTTKCCLPVFGQRVRDSICFGADLLVHCNFLDRGSVLEPVAGFDTSVTAEMAGVLWSHCKRATLRHRIQ
ncbi:hypothetical protein JG688_00004591 [Phytophthora aleatoria]|uniref:Uncharacterized protein n=1 Tax=Phytophthora aleatoria TaxID=2496075 RepID=A0A8J5IQT0_9STRA|nr:hypothetical protein GQ600_15746 [Phytophthora cactorum]KAG6971055.1 hypothetical protein JG688_00004591 [Phytophthora aleatoria]